MARHSTDRYTRPTFMLAHESGLVRSSGCGRRRRWLIQSSCRPISESAEDIVRRVQSRQAQPAERAAADPGSMTVLANFGALG